MIGQKLKIKNNMKTTNRTTKGLLIGIIVFLAAVAAPNLAANANPILSNAIYKYMPTEAEISELLAYYGVEELQMAQFVKVQVFNNHLDLVYSDTMCQNDYECDKRLNILLNQSDFITEIDNKKIYMLK